MVQHYTGMKASSSWQNLVTDTSRSSGPSFSEYKLSLFSLWRKLLVQKKLQLSKGFAGLLKKLFTASTEYCFLYQKCVYVGEGSGQGRITGKATSTILLLKLLLASKIDINAPIQSTSSLFGAGMTREEDTIGISEKPCHWLKKITQNRCSWGKLKKNPPPY